MRHVRTFVDSNVLLYMFSRDEDQKRQAAIEAVRDLGSQMVLSTQVLVEFYSVATRKFKLEAHTARNVIHEFSQGEVVITTPLLVGDAIDLSIVTGYTIWDSMIVQAAVSGRCQRLLTENLSHGQTVKGVRIENPFS